MRREATINRFPIATIYLLASRGYSSSNAPVDDRYQGIGEAADMIGSQRPRFDSMHQPGLNSARLDNGKAEAPTIGTSRAHEEIFRSDRGIARLVAQIFATCLPYPPLGSVEFPAPRAMRDNRKVRILVRTMFFVFIKNHKNMRKTQRKRAFLRNFLLMKNVFFSFSEYDINAFKNCGFFYTRNVDFKI